MDTVCQGQDFTFVYIYDILVASEDEDTHLDHLHQLFQRLKDYGLVVNVSNERLGLNHLISLVTASIVTGSYHYLTRCL